MIRVRKDVHSGCVTEVLIYNQAAGGKPRAPRKPRFADAEAYENFKNEIGKKAFARLINANYTPADLKGTLTFDDEHELYSFKDARRVRSAYVRRIRRRCPNAKIIIVMGRGKSTARIHFHFLMSGVPEKVIAEAWTRGEIVECKHLREHNKYDGIDHGRDYTALANYYWDHWTAEQGGHHYYATRNHAKAEEEAPEAIKREYTEAKPPKAPKGYKLVESKATPFGFLYFKFVKILS